MKTFLRKLLRVLGPMALASAVFMPSVALADVPVVTQSQTLAATGTITTPLLTGQTQCSATLSGTWTGTVTFQASSDYGVTYTAIPTTTKGSTTTATTTTANGVFITPISSDQFYQLSWSRASGSLVAYISCAGGTSPFIGAIPVTIPTSAPGGSTANPAYNRLQDGTTTNLATVDASGNVSVKCTSGSNCPVNALLQAGSANAGGFELFDSAGTNKLSISLPGGALVRQGKTATILTSASATSCTNVQATAGTLVEIINVGSAMTVFPAFFNDAAATCATGTRVYGNGSSLVLAAGQAVVLNIPLSAGLAYSLSGSLTDNLVLVTQ